LYYHKHDEFIKAIRDYSKIIKLDPTSVDAYLYRAELYRFLADKQEKSTNKYKQAIKDLTYAMKLNPQDKEFVSKIYLLRSSVYLELPRLEQHLKDRRKAAAFRCEDYYNERVEIYLELDQPELALEESNKNISSHPEDPNVFINRGRTYMELNKYKEALCDYQKAIEIEPQCKEAYYYRGIIYKKLGDEKEAFRNIKIAAKMGYKPAKKFVKEMS